MELRKFIISAVKQKRELADISDDFVGELLDKYIEGNKKLWLCVTSHHKIEKSREAKIIVKELRKKLREVHGVFEINLNKRTKLFLELKHLIAAKAPEDEIIELHKKILLTHKSTRERLDYYEETYKKIFSITGKPKSILDIGAGLNPLSFIFMNLKNVNYYANELTDEDCSFLNDYFKLMKIEGIAIKTDLLKENNFPKVDVCLIFKVLDSLESMEWGSSKRLLDSINADFIVVSFPKKTLSGKPLSTKRLTWFMKLAKNFIEFEIENEIFYIIKQN